MDSFTALSFIHYGLQVILWEGLLILLPFKVQLTPQSNREGLIKKSYASIHLFYES